MSYQVYVFRLQRIYEICLVCKFLMNPYDLHLGKRQGSQFFLGKMNICLVGGNIHEMHDAYLLATLKTQSLTETLNSEAVSSSCIF